MQRNAADNATRVELPEVSERGLAMGVPANVLVKETRHAAPRDAIYAACDGRKENRGTRLSPYSLQHAMETAPEGGTVVLRGGTYRVGGLDFPRRLVLQPAQGETVWLKGSVVVGDWTRDGAAWRHDGWAAAFPPGGYNATVLDKIIERNYPMAAHGDMVFMDGVALSQVGSREELQSGRFHVDYEEKVLFLGDDPTGKMVEATVQAFGLRIRRKGALNASGSVVRGIGFAHYADHGMGVGARDVLVEDCTFVWNGDTGLNINPWVGGIENSAPSDCVVRGNTFTANGQAGASIAYATRLIVEGNTFACNNVERFRRDWAAAGIKLVECSELILRSNLAVDNHATGIWMDINVNGALVHHNKAINNAAIGIFFEISDECVIAFNVCRGNNTGIQVSNATRAQVWNNTLIDNGRAFYAQWWQRTNHDGRIIANIPSGGEYVTRDNIFKNNLVVVTQRKKGPLVEAQGGPEASSRRISESDFNAYRLAPDAVGTPFARWAVNSGEARLYKSRGDFTRDEPEYERNSCQLSEDPFADFSNNDFRLKPQVASRMKPAPLPTAVARLTGEPVDHMGALPPVQ